jgi:predicted nuclease with TOPRIM domain
MRKTYLSIGLLAMLLGACKQKDDQAAALADLQAQMEEMQKEREGPLLVDEAVEEEDKGEGSDAPKISEGELENLKIENKILQGTFDRSKETLEKSEGKIEELEKKLEKLQKEFEDYRKKYVSKIRAKAEGMKLATLKVPSGKIYKDVVISEVTELRIKLRHAGGAASLNVDTAPSEWVEKYALVSKESLLPEPDASGDADRLDKEEMDASDAIAIITGDKGVGTGFFVEGKGAYYLYTAAHVLSGNEKLMGTNLSALVDLRSLRT